MADVGGFLEQAESEGFEPTLDPSVDLETLHVMMTPAKLADTNPFGGADVYVTELDREVNTAQLADEIGESAGFEVQLSVVNRRPGTPIGEDNPAKIYVHPPVDGRVVRGKIKSHQIDDLYGLTSDQRDRIVLVGKLRRHEELTPDETARVLRLALTNP